MESPRKKDGAASGKPSQEFLDSNPEYALAWDIYEEMRRVGVTTTAHFNETVYAAMRRYAQRNFDSGRRVQALLDAPEPRAEAGETIRLHRMAHWDDGVWDCCYVKSCSFDEHAYFQRTAAPGQQEKP